MSQKETVCSRLKEYACVPVEQVKQKFNVTGKGFTREQASKRRHEYGSNSLPVNEYDTVAACVRRAFVNPFSMILFLLGIISYLTDIMWTDGYRKNPTTVGIIFSMLMISGTVRLIREFRSRKIAGELSRLTDTTVQVLRNGNWMELSSAELVSGDQIRLEAGDRVPADLRLTETEKLLVSQSVISGESVLFEKTAETLTEEPENMADYRNILFSGTTVIGGHGTGIVVAVGQETVYGGLTPVGAERKRGFEQGANSVAWVLIHFMAVLVPVVFVASGLTKGNWLEAFVFALSVAVGLIPELLPMVVNACLAKGSCSMGKKQTLVKNINAMQGFGSMDVLCVDKTGTLTGDQIFLEYYMDILGNESRKVLDYAYLASCFHTGPENHLDAAVCRAREMPGRADYYRELAGRYVSAEELPFDYGRRYAGVLLNDGKEKMMIIKGSIDEVVHQCSQIEYRGKQRNAGPDALKNAHAVADEMLEDGMKVIAVAYRTFSDTMSLQERKEGFILLGYLAFFDAPKQSAASAVRKLQSLRVNVKVLTGDQKKTTLSVCRRLGIRTDSCLTGAQIAKMSDGELLAAAEKTDVFAELSPKQKAVLVEKLQSAGHTAGFLGDGINDLPALLQANVGISVENAAEAAKESADVILMKKDLNVLEEGILEGRKAFVNMWKYIRITSSSNFGNICAVVAASVLLPFFPMTSVQLLLLNLLYDILCLILPWDRVDEEMLVRPLEWSGKTLGKFMMFFGPVSTVFDLLTFVFLYVILCPAECHGTFSSLGAEGKAQFIALFQTGWFLESMWTQVLILQLLRTAKLPFIQSRPGGWVIGISALGIMLFTILTVTPVGRLLGMTAMPPGYFLFLASVAAGYLMAVTVVKQWYIRKNHELM